MKTISQLNEDRAAVRCGWEVITQTGKNSMDDVLNIYLKLLNQRLASKAASEMNTLETSIHRHVQFALDGNAVAIEAICRFIYLGQR